MDFKQLLEQYREGRLSAEQRAAFEQLLHDRASEEQLRELLDESLKDIPPVEAEETQKFLFERLRHQYIRNNDNTGAQRRIAIIRANWFKAAAAAVLLLAGGALWWWSTHTNSHNGLVDIKAVTTQDIPPGHNGAILTLSDGTQIDLDTSAAGQVAQQNGARVVLKNGTLAYHKEAQGQRQLTYNTISTPKGRQFNLILPDGSKVWLNTASTITYPTLFDAKLREVAIKGEVYMEVAAQAARPFIVKIDESTKIEVLGTSFNVNAYDDEAAIKTTLLQGVVRLSTIGRSRLLKPGMQAQVNSAKEIRMTEDVDVSQVTAWKDGLFNFNGYDIKMMMRELSRWYDLEVVYEGEPDTGEVAGEIQRDLSLQQVMKILQKLHINYSIEGRRIIIRK